MYTNPMRDKYVWEKLEQGRHADVKREAQEVRRSEGPRPARHERSAAWTHRLLLALGAAVPIGVLILWKVVAH